jgi:hypothetical protein
MRMYGSRAGQVKMIADLPDAGSVGVLTDKLSDKIKYFALALG